MVTWEFFRTDSDYSKAKSLLKQAEATLERLEITPKFKYPSNTLVDYYDSIHKLMEAITSIDGIKFADKGSHYLLIKYICDKYLPEYTDFLQDMRLYRNQISYEGRQIQPNYPRNIPKIETILKKLKQIIIKKN
ncbi:MAG: hypothetical protein ABIG95_00035 [Candidatus Woesearchaeota archaeon]